MLLKLAELLMGAIGIYLLIALILSTLPHIRTKTVSEKSKQLLPNIHRKAAASQDACDQILLVQDMTTAFDARVQLLRSATSSVDIVYHTIQSGSSTDAFFGEVVKAAERGVTVRILLDAKAGMMSSSVRKKLQILDSHPGIACREFNPVRWLRPWEWHTLLHDKFIIADEAYLMLGGRNLGDRFYNPDGYAGALVDDWEALVFGNGSKESVLPRAAAYMNLLWNHPLTVAAFKKHKENMAEYRQLMELADAFEHKNPKFYQCSLGQYRETAVPAAITLLYNPVHTGQKEPWVGYQLKKLAMQAADSVLIQTPYSTANRFLLNTLTQVGKNAEVTILTNSMAGSPNYPAFSNYYYNRKKFITTGATIYEYQNGDSIHGKAMVFDHRFSALGSLNLDDRSLHIDTETMLLVDSSEFAAVLTDAITKYVRKSLKLGKDNQYEGRAGIPPSQVPPGKQFAMFLTSVFSRIFQFLI